MRILAIRGENLASLTAFDVPLATGPLAGAGLFAITGDTGAGKSTILDAMCLALYGKYPRTSAGGGERVTDAGGEDLQASDPRHILRRGAASGYAETDFAGIDGLTYRARWEVRRARGRATGRLQNAEHTLALLDGGGTISSGRRDTLAAVEERTGFTFEQFCRTVLLAQGEFDRFLLADETQRAELLEKITGTAIYSRISERVYKEADQRWRALEDLERQRGGIDVLDDAARQALAAGRTEKSALLEAALADVARIDASLAHTERIAAARRDLDLAETSVGMAARAIAAANGDREHLEALRAVEPLRAKAATFDRCRAVAASAEAKFDAATAQLKLAMDARDATAELLRTVEEAAGSAVAGLARCEPEWARAAALDVQIATAETEFRDAQRAFIVASQADTRAVDAADEAGKHLAAAMKACEDADAARSACAPHEPIATNLVRIETAAAERLDFISRQSALRANIMRLSGEIDETEARIKAALSAGARHGTRRDQIVVQLEQKRCVLAAMDLPKLELRRDGLVELAGAVDRALAAMVRRDEARSMLEGASGRLHQSESEEQAAHARAFAASQAHGLHITARGDLQVLVDLADATVSQDAVHLRSVLADGEPCPVCGSASHPFAHDTGAASRLAQGIRDQRLTLDRAIETARQALLQAQTEVARAAITQTAISAEVLDARGKATAAQIALVATAPQIAELAREHGCEALVRAFDGEAVTAQVIVARQELAGEIGRLSKERQAATALRGESEQLQAAIDAAAGEAQAERDAAEALRETLAAATAGRTTATATLEALALQIAANMSELGPYLAAAGIAAADFDQQAVAARTRLRQLAEQFIALDSDRTRLHNEAGQARTSSHAAAERKLLAQGARAAAQQTLDVRSASLNALLEQRGLVLDGEATAAHRDRTIALAAAARQARDAALADWTKSDRTFTACEAQLGPARDAWAAAKSEFTQASLDWLAGTAAVAVTPEHALGLLGVPGDAVADLGARLDRLDLAHTQGIAAVQLRRGDLDALLAVAADLDAASAGRLREERAVHIARCETVTAERVQIDFKLANDDGAREKMQTIGHDIAAVKADHEIWSAVDDAVGASTGAKFRRFAQGVTLGHLVHLANQQLAALNPRYGLRVNPTSELSLDVVDGDMGDEIRGPRSLSGGERFLVSLALALALSGLEGRQSFVDSLFIDEGFGGLDRDTLDMAIDALESLQSHGRKVGVITHVAAMIERIPVQVCVEKRGGGRSCVRLQDNGPVYLAKLPAAAE